jgi:hypothetical protein
MNTTKTTASTLETDRSVKLPLAAAALALALLVIPHSGHAQGVVRGMEGGAHHGAREGGRAAGPVGAVVGGAVGASPSLSAPPSLLLIRRLTIATAASTATDKFLLFTQSSFPDPHPRCGPE